MSFDYVEDINPVKTLTKTKKHQQNKDSINSDDEDQRDSWGIPRNHNPHDIYCCICGNSHHESTCVKRLANNST